METFQKLRPQVDASSAIAADGLTRLVFANSASVDELIRLSRRLVSESRSLLRSIDRQLRAHHSSRLSSR